MYKKICIYSFKINRVFGFSFAFKILKVIAILKWKHAKNPLLIPLGPFGGGGGIVTKAEKDTKEFETKKDCC